MTDKSLAKDKIRILLLEGPHQSAVDVFNENGYHNIEYIKGSLPEDELKQKIANAHFVGIRSRTNLTADVFATAKKLVGVGCFCIGTNQVDLEEAKRLGIAVFNAPFSNTRSVAELVLGEILLLLRDIPAKNAKVHRGEWDKSAAGSVEARGKTLGIVGYGHIGIQLSIMAENIGMNVIFHDIETKLPLSNASQVKSLEALLKKSDIVSLHVPETEETQNMMGAEQFALMKKGAIFINAARGTVVDIDALAAALTSGHLSGAAIDVFPEEPKSNDEEFQSPLRGMDNVILTPHIGGSTEEAQENIGLEVATKLVRYSDTGTTLSAKNFPEVSLPEHRDRSRLLHIHQNRPGIMTKINEAFAAQNINVAAQYLQTNNEIGYVVIDIDSKDRETGLKELQAIDGTIRTRVLH
ncbi:phosphoglycerate dehydrogenase [Hydrogenovibrio sp. SC-1]|uniref:phosphoglycerate dehydrogenase n=1 Tax=Hydrogenovibrio sp. SC-1 TaxID=2065820 RepID=UPI000C7E6932|nr:phosphoglycerate dehydrogenase [Hydrogenovibrio sp. SC-1]PLA75522.1 phosphoglycerate dehydrogenase [Hydrogenovibrio sp. SC-1]